MVSAKALAGVVIVVIVLSAFVGLSLLHHGTSQETTQSTTSTTMTSTTSSSSTPLAGGFAKGLAFSPATYDATGTSDFFAKAQQAGGIVEWAGDWEQLGGAPTTISQLAPQNGLGTMVVVQFFSQSTGQLLRPLNSTNEQNYLNLTTSFLGEHKPAYFGVGIEVNILYEEDPADFQSFVSFYSQVYDVAKAASPSTQVFTIFQLEKMNGLNGGLYGGVNDPNSTEWQLLSLFPKDDILAFTSYPGLVYHDPSQIPTDYYSSIASHSNLSVGFTELGWQSGSLGGGWNSNESQQAAFVTRFFDLTTGLNKAFAVWSFLYDQSAPAPFNSMGLLYVNGTAKQAWSSWLAG